MKFDEFVVLHLRSLIWSQVLKQKSFNNIQKITSRNLAASCSSDTTIDLLNTEVIQEIGGIRIRGPLSPWRRVRDLLTFHGGNARKAGAPRVPSDSGETQISKTLVIACDFRNHLCNESCRRLPEIYF